MILGHHGMLGNAALRYFKDKAEILTTELRWQNNDFKIFLITTPVDFIINCIGAIPQKAYAPNDFHVINVNLPKFLSILDAKVIHPSTDCEFSGDLPFPHKYQKNDVKDGEDPYGKSKITTSDLIEKEFHNTKAIRTSIIGHETTEKKYSLLEWFLTQNEANGYTNHYWNGITTLQWAKIAQNIMNDWDNYDRITQVGTEGYSKFALLYYIKNAYRINIKINPYRTDKTVNRMLLTDFSVPDILTQLIELREFYK